MGKNVISLSSIKKNAKTRGSGGGGNRRPYKFGIWYKKGQARHIKTGVLGIKPSDRFILAVEDNKIIFYLLNSKQVEQVEKEGVTVFKTDKDGFKNGVQTYQNYSVIEGIDEELYKEIVRVNGGAVTRSIKNPEDKKYFDKYIVKKLDEFTK